MLGCFDNSERALLADLQAIGPRRLDLVQQSARFCLKNRMIMSFRNMQVEGCFDMYFESILDNKFNVNTFTT
jgi:hypothetical protein